MIKYSAFIIFTICSVQIFAQKTDLTQGKMDTVDALRIRYIAQYKDYAIAEMIRSGIPASITLAQGILETAAGTSKLCKEANNHFGMKCSNNWDGPAVYKNDDEYNKQGVIVKSCFRQYESIEDNFADHSSFLRDPRKAGRYGFLFELDPTDYVSWAKGLQAAGYSPVGHYSARLVEFIERYHLDELDQYAVRETKMSKNIAMARRRLFRLNDAEMIFAQEGETLAQLARLFGTDAATLSGYNDDFYKTTTPLKAGTILYFEVKSSEWAGEDEMMSNWLGQTTFEIAQRFGIRLDALRAMNNLAFGQEPAPGAKIRLRGSPQPNEVVKLRSKGKNKPVKIKTAKDLPALALMPAPYPLSAANQRNLDRIIGTKPVVVSAPNRAHNRSHVSAASTSPDFEIDLHDEPIVIETDSAITVEYTIPGSNQNFHRVESGQTLAAIAREYATTIESIQKMNKLKGSVIQPGQILRVK